MSEPTSTRQLTDFRSRLYERYASTHAASEQPELGAPALLRNIVRRLPRDRSATILDVGSGQGELLRQLRDAGYSNVEGIDVSPEQVAIARRQGLPVTQGSLLPFLSERKGQADAICAVDVLEHFKKHEILELLDVMAAALVPGGILVAQVPNGESPFAGRYRYGDFTHSVAFTQRSVAQIANVSGFSSVEVFPTEPVPHGVASTVRLCVWKTISCMMKLCLFAETGVVRGHVVTQNLVFTARTARTAHAVLEGPLARGR